MNNEEKKLFGQPYFFDPASFKPRAGKSFFMNHLIKEYKVLVNHDEQQSSAGIVLVNIKERA